MAPTDATTTATTDPRRTQEDGWKRLAEAVTARREELMLTKQAAAVLAGISLNGFRRVEEAVPLRNSTLIGVDKAMGWEVGSSARLVQTGAEPVLVDDRKDGVDSDLYESLLTAISSLNVGGPAPTSKHPFITVQVKLSEDEAESLSPELRKEVTAATHEVVRLFISFSMKAMKSA